MTTIDSSLALTQVNSTNDSPKIAWLLQGAGAYWQPIISEFAQLFPNTKVFAADWPGFLPGFEDSFAVQKVGEIKVFSLNRSAKGYSPSFTYLSPKVIVYLFQYKPDLVFSVGFTIWTILAILFKGLCGWRVAIVYDGSSPGVDHRNSRLRMFLRKAIARFTDVFITNNQAGKTYLVEALGAKEKRVVARPYLVPHPKAYERTGKSIDWKDDALQRPVFIFVGGLIPRKGIRELLEACAILKRQNRGDFTLAVLGRGTQRSELEAFVKTHQLEEQVKWLGEVEYAEVGTYLQKADVFVFPTLEDVWGLVAVEAMMFGKPILCSKWAGAVELVADGENGYIFDPHQPEQLAQKMSKLIDSPELIKTLGEKSREIMTEHKPEAVVESLIRVVEIAFT
jgi:glycosyltransferase involved in cell wall biosynthesis